MKRKFVGTMMVLVTSLSLFGCSDTEELVTKPKEKAVEVVKEEPAKEPVVTKEDIEKKEMKVYGEKVELIMTGSSQAMFDLSDLFTSVSENPQMINDPNFRKDIVEVYQRISQHSREFKAVNPVPQRFSESHALIINSFDLLVESRDRILQGIDMMDVNQIIEGSNLITESNTKLTEANQIMDEIVLELLK